MSNANFWACSAFIFLILSFIRNVITVPTMTLFYSQQKSYVVVNIFVISILYNMTCFYIDHETKKMCRTSVTKSALF